nr:LysM domain-containing protein [Paenibacillus larvae]
MSFRYVVQEGDTWHRIARIHAVNLSSLTSMNPGIKETEYLVPGKSFKYQDRPIGNMWYSLKRPRWLLPDGSGSP